MRDYVAIYNGKTVYFKADSLYAAKRNAIKLMKVPKSKQGLLSVCLSDVPVDVASL